MAASFEDTKNYLAPKEYFAAKLRSIGNSGLRLAFVSEQATANGAVFCISHGISAKSFGENITVTLDYLESATRVTVLSRCIMPTQIFDFNKNKNNVAAIFRYLEADINSIPK